MMNLALKPSLPPPRLTNGAQSRQIDAVLSFIVSGAAAIDAITNRGRSPRIEIIPPFSVMPSTTSPCPYIRTVGADELSRYSATR